MIHPLKKRKWVPLLSEIHAYVNDLERVTALRDKCEIFAERESYNIAIDVMLKVFVFLNSDPSKL